MMISNIMSWLSLVAGIYAFVFRDDSSAATVFIGLAIYFLVNEILLIVSKGRAK
jgi:hypothetical protein